MGIPARSRHCHVGDHLPPGKPSQIRVDLSGVQPKSSQIGVYFSEQPLIGVELRGLAALCLLPGLGLATTLKLSYVKDHAQSTLQPRAEYRLYHLFSRTSSKNSGVSPFTWHLVTCSAFSGHFTFNRKARRPLL